MSTHDDEPRKSTAPGASSIGQSNLASFDEKAGRNKRKSPWVSSYHAIKYVNALPRKKFRKTDKITEVLIFACLLFVAMLLFIPTTVLKPPIILLVDFTLSTVIFFFVLKRLGILITLNERQAVLVWDIVVAAFMSGILFCFNAMLFINYLIHLPLKF